MHVWNSFDPVVFPLLRDRRLALVILAIGAVLIGLFAFGISAWPCPVLHATGIPCPGCGLTRATLFLLRGDLRTSLRYHAFAPVFLLGAGAISVAGLLPERLRLPVLEKLENFERRTGALYVLSIALVLYWLARLVFLNASFVQLIRG
jgi:uncharacterized protein DUF2752